MDYEEACQLWSQIRATTCTDMKDIMVDTAVRYAALRVEWLFAGEYRHQVDLDRTNCHNSLIAACEALARSMAKAGEDIAWHRALGTDRKRIGDFGCFVHYTMAISAR